METNALALNLLAQRARAADEGWRAHRRDVEPRRAARDARTTASSARRRRRSKSLVRALAQELGPRGIRVNTVSAGVVDTDALDVLPEPRRAARGFRASARRRAGAARPKTSRRRLPAVPAGSGDDQRAHAGRRRRLLHLRLMQADARSGLAGKRVHRHRRQPRHRPRDRRAPRRRRRATSRSSTAATPQAAQDVVARCDARGPQRRCRAGRRHRRGRVRGRRRAVRRPRRPHRRAGEQRWRRSATIRSRRSTTTTSASVLDTNVGGVFNVTRAVVPHMIMQRAGRSSTSARSPAKRAAAARPTTRRARARSTRSRARWPSSSRRGRSRVNCGRAGRDRDRDVAGACATWPATR